MASQANKIMSPDDAVAVIQDGDTVAISGFVGIGVPDELIIALERRFLATGHPCSLTLLFAAAPGDGKELGINRLAHEGLFKRVVGGHYSLVPRLADMALDNKFEAYNLPLGSIAHLYRDVAAGRPGSLSKIGLRTFVDPRLGGGKLNASTEENLVELHDIAGETFLFYKAFPIHVAIIRGTTADPDGNVTMEREALPLDGLALAMAARNSGGLVLTQVERVAANETLNPREVQLPGILVDCVVVAEKNNHRQTYAADYNHAYSGRQRVPLDRVPPQRMSERKIVGRRCAFELPVGGVINLGIGVPESLAAVAVEEHVLRLVTLTAEPGVIGGIPQGGLSFGACLNPAAIIHQNQQFDFYDGGGLDLACLGMAQVDVHGNVNVSRFGRRLAGSGGFINISQTAKKVLFAGTFTTGGLSVESGNGKLSIVREGTTNKFLQDVEEITYSGPYGVEKGQSALYITERCVFRNTLRGLELIEVAPGIDIERDILARMDFKPIIEDPKLMDERIFLNEPMLLEDILLAVTLPERIEYNAEKNTMFVNLEGLEMRNLADVERMRAELEKRCRKAGRRVQMIANYNGFILNSKIADAYFSMITYMQNRYYLSVARYSTSAFMRLKLADALVTRELAPSVFETHSEAQEGLAEQSGRAPLKRPKRKPTTAASSTEAVRGRTGRTSR
jgi:propionate CoA-transferase